METTALVHHRILFLSEPVTQESANRLIAGLLLLDAADRTEAIDLYVNSPGGSVTDGMAIIDTMHAISAPVRTICVGKAASMAAWIVAAGSPGTRLATANSELMLHQAAGGFSGPSSDVQIHATRMLRWQERLIALLSSWTGQPVSRITRDVEREMFMSAPEALEYGLVDRIAPQHFSAAADSKG